MSLCWIFAWAKADLIRRKDDALTSKWRMKEAMRMDGIRHFVRLKDYQKDVHLEP